jgi:hypothetical protein
MGHSIHLHLGRVPLQLFGLQPKIGVIRELITAEIISLLLRRGAEYQPRVPMFD